MIKKFKKFNERLNISDLDDKTSSTIKYNLLFRLKEYRTYILSNIDIVDNEIIYKNFNNIDIRTIKRELIQEFTETTYNDFNMDTFLNDINDILNLKEKNVRLLIIERFKKLYDVINKL